MQAGRDVPIVASVHPVEHSQPPARAELQAAGARGLEPVFNFWR